MHATLPSLSLPRPGWLAAAVLGVALLAPAAGAEPTAELCVECHDDFDLDTFGASQHGFLECGDCHEGDVELPPPEHMQPPSCSVCHEDVVEAYAGSVHGMSRGDGAEEAPGCITCHGDIHALMPPSDPGAPTHPLNLADTCGACHADPELVEKYGLPRAKPFEAYEQSVHARLLAQEGIGPSCSDCHESHGIYPPTDPRSTVYRPRVPDTCGECHAEIAAAFRQSVHGEAAARGERESPVCTDCHGEHRILSPREKGSRAHVSNVPKMTCGRCHDDVTLAEKYGLPTGKVASYADSYHGLAGRSGRTTVAHCGSCHGVHDILPSSDPRSHIHQDNLAETCGQCHPGAGSTFAIGPVHTGNGNGEHVVVRWVRVTYLWLIILSVGGMLLHNLLDFVRKVIRPPARIPRGPVHDEVRMMKGFRIAHGLLLSSFIVLAYSGFALKYPEAWWARPLRGWGDDFDLRGWAHRGAALVIMAALVFHLIHLITSRRARTCMAGMVPRLDDLRELRERMRYYLGLRPDPPHTPSLGYPEKMEYLALMWGMVVMAMTGFLLWFENLALRWAPLWVSDLATVIHFYEAILATLAILVWHFYFVIFDPVVYPMDPAWLTGRAALGRVLERRGATDSATTEGPSDERTRPPDEADPSPAES